MKRSFKRVLLYVLGAVVLAGAILTACVIRPVILNTPAPPTEQGPQ